MLAEWDPAIKFGRNYKEFVKDFPNAVELNTNPDNKLIYETSAQHRNQSKRKWPIMTEGAKCYQFKPGALT